MSDITLDLKHFYSLQNEAEISAFLEANPFLYDFLREVYSVLKNYFPDTSLTLEITHDPEENTQTLLLSIQTLQNEAETHPRWEQFIDEWWLNYLDAGQGKLALGLSFQ